MIRDSRPHHRSRPLRQSNALNVAFIISGALVGERALDWAVHSAWRRNNSGKLYEDQLGKTIGVMEMEEEEDE